MKNLAVATIATIAFLSPGWCNPISVPTDDFSRLLLRIQCDNGCESSEFSAQPVSWHREGDPGFEDPGELSVFQAEGKPTWVLGFPLTGYQKALHTATLPWPGWMAVLLNERTSSGSNHVALTLWRKKDREWILESLVQPGVSIPVGEFTLKESRPRGQGSILLFEALGHDAGLNSQIYVAFHLKSPTQTEFLGHFQNRTETCIESVLSALNAGETPDPLFDSTATCRLAKNGAILDCQLRRVRIQHTLEGPVETDLGSRSFQARFLRKED
jgi:hypothetical protein